MNIYLRVPGDIPLIYIGYKYKYQKFLGFIASEGDGIIDPDDTYLSRFPDTYYNVSICPTVCTCILVRYSNACNSIENHNKMRK